MTISTVKTGAVSTRGFVNGFRKHSLAQIFFLRRTALQITAAASLLLLGVLSGSAQQPAAQRAAGSEQLLASTASNEKENAAVPAAATVSATPPAIPSATRAPAPAATMEAVLRLLQTQGQEIELLRAALLEQQRVSARLEQKLNAEFAAACVAAGPGCSRFCTPSSTATSCFVRPPERS